MPNPQTTQIPLSSLPRSGTAPALTDTLVGVHANKTSLQYTLAQVQQTIGGGGGTGANPTATASDVAVNGVATTFLRSDGAPAVQKGSSSQFGIVQVDGATITAVGGIISAQSGSGLVTRSTTPPPNPTAGEIWFNPDTNQIAVASVAEYSWSPNLSAGNISISNGGLTATRSDSTYPNIITPGVAGAKSSSLIPTSQKFIFAITTTFISSDGQSGFGISGEAQTVGNGMYLGFPNPSPGIGYYQDNTSFFYFLNNATGLSQNGSYQSGLYYAAIDPVAKLMWVKNTLNSGYWNGDPSANPVTGVGGQAFAFDISTARICVQLAHNTGSAVIDPTASGLTLSGFAALSQIISWVPVAEPSDGTVNIKRDFGAVGNGTADDGASFQAFTKAYQGQNVSLCIPYGTYQSSSNSLGLWSGIKQLTIVGYGASISGNLTPFGGTNDQYKLSNSALIQNAKVGDTQLTLVSSGDASKFSSGDWIMIGGLDVEGVGIPPNCHYMEFVQVDTVSGSAVFIKDYVRGGPYLSTFPYYSSNASGVNEGGPATIWNMTTMLPDWDADIFVYGLTFLGGADMPAVRNKIYKDCSWPGLGSSNWPVNISQGKSIIFDHCSIQGGGEIEVDKNIERLVFRDCNLVGYFNALLFQSSSVQQLLIDNTDISTLDGTPKNTYIHNSRILQLNPTPRSNGVMESLFVEDSYIGSISFTGWANSFGGAEAISNYTFSNGTFTKVNSGSASVVPWAAPGAKCIFEDSSGFFRSPPSFTVLAVDSDSPGTPGSGNIKIRTTLSSIPTWTQGTAPNNVFLPTLIAQHPYGRVTFKNCWGQRYVMNWQDTANPVRDAGVGFQYAKLLLTGDATTVLGNSNARAEGAITAININVLRAYTGSNGTEHLNCENFQIYDLSFAGTAGLTFAVNVKTAGLRSWSAGSWSGAAAGDTLPTIAAGSWLWGYPEWHFDNGMGGDALGATPVVTVEIITDAGIIEFSVIDYASSYIQS